METKKENYFIVEHEEQIERFIQWGRCSPEIRDISIRCAAPAHEFIDIP